MSRVHEQIEEIEALIVEALGRKPRPRSSEHTAAVLKSIAADLRAGMPGAPGDALVALQAVINDALKSKTALGMSEGHLVRVGHELIGLWPTVRQALEKFDGGRDVSR